MKDADLRRAWNRLVRKGKQHDTEQCFRAFVAGFEYGGGFHAYSSTPEEMQEALKELAEKQVEDIDVSGRGMDNYGAL